MADSANTILVTIRLADELTQPFDALMAHVDQRVGATANQTQGGAQSPQHAATTIAAQSAAHREPAAAHAEASHKVVESEQEVGDKAEEAGGKLVKATAIGVLGFDALKQSIEGAVRLLSGGPISQAIGAFAEIKGVEEFGKATEEAAEHGSGLMAVLGRVAPVAAGAAVAIGGVSLSAYELAKSSAESATEIDNLRRASGLAIESVLALRKAFAGAGVQPQEVQLALRGLASRIQESWAGIGDNVRDSADRQTSAVDGVKESLLGYSEALDKIKDAAVDAAEAQDKLADAQAGVKNAKFDAEQAQIDKERAEIRYGQFYGERPDAGRLANLNRREAWLKVRRAEEHADEAPRRVREAEADEQKAESGPARAQRNLERAQIEAQRSEIGVHQAENAQSDLRRDLIPEIVKAIHGEPGAVNLREVSASRIFDAIVSMGMGAAGPGHPEQVERNTIEQLGRFVSRAQTDPNLQGTATDVVRQFYPGRGDVGGVEAGLMDFARRGRFLEEETTGRKGGKPSETERVENAIPPALAFNKAQAERADTTEGVVRDVGARISATVTHAMEGLTSGLEGSRETLVKVAGTISDTFDAAANAAKALSQAMSDAQARLSAPYNKAALERPEGGQSLHDLAETRDTIDARLETARQHMTQLRVERADISRNPEERADFANTQARVQDLQAQRKAAGTAYDTADRSILDALKGGAENAKSGLDNVREKADGAASALDHLRGAASAAKPETETQKPAGEPAEATEAHALGGPILIPGHADGGMIHGPGTGTSDSVFRYLHEGDFVIKASATEKLGHTFLDRLNGGAFAKGGRVPAYVSDGEYLVKSTAVERLGLPLLHFLNGVGSHAEGGEIRRFADGGYYNEDIDAITGPHVGYLSNDKWRRITAALNRFNHRPDPGWGGSVAFGTAPDDSFGYHAPAGAPTAKYEPATQGKSKQIDAPNAGAQAAANVAKKPETEAPHVPGVPVEHAVPPTTGVLPGPLGEMLHQADRAPALPVLQSGQVEGKPEAAPQLPEVHTIDPAAKSGFEPPWIGAEYHAKFDAEIPRKTGEGYGPSLSMSAGDSKPWRPGEMGLGGADFYSPGPNDHRVMVQTDRAHEKAELKPAGTKGGVRLDRALHEYGDAGPGSVVFSNSERPLYGDAETWRHWESGAVSTGVSRSHEAWDKRHPEDDPTQGLYASGGSILGDVIQHFATGGLAGGARGAAEGGSSSWLRWDKGEDGEPRLRLAIGGFAGPGAGDGSGGKDAAPMLRFALGGPATMPKLGMDAEETETAGEPMFRFAFGGIAIPGIGGGVGSAPGFTAPTTGGNSPWSGWTGLLNVPTDSSLSRGFGFSGASLPGLDVQSLTQSYAQMLTSSLSAGHEFDSILGGGADAISGAIGGTAGHPNVTGWTNIDLTTDHGTLSALVADSAMQSVRTGAIGARITSTGMKPSWMSGG